MEKSTQKARSSPRIDNQSENKNKTQPKFQEERFTFTTEKINNEESGISSITTNNYCQMALKNPETFMVLSDESGIHLIKNNIEVHSQTHPVEFGRALRGPVYITHLDRFLFLNSTKIYLKEINERPFYLWMDLSPHCKYVTFLGYSPMNERLIALVSSKNSNKLLSINLDTKTVEIDLKQKLVQAPKNLIIFGENENHLLVLNESGVLSWICLNYEMRKVLSSHFYKIGKMKNLREEARSMVVCDKNRFILVDLYKNLSYSSRMVLLEINRGKLTEKAVYDCFAENNNYKIALSCCGYFGGHILWIGLEFFSQTNNAQIFDFDLETGELKELRDKRIGHEEYCPTEMYRHGNQFFYTGLNGKVMKLVLTFSP